MSAEKKHVFVCAQQRPPGHPRGSCQPKGGADILQAFWAEQQKRNLGETLAITYCGCLGPCDAGPNVLVFPGGTLYSGVSKDDVAEIIDSHLLGDTPVQRLIRSADSW